VQVGRRADQGLARDLGSKNGAEIGGARLDQRDRVWPLDQELRVGQNRFAYRHPAIEALGELERAADEKIREGESIAPPEPPVVTVENESAARNALGGSRSPDGTGRDLGAAAPIAEMPRASPRERARKPGWTSTDFAVVLLAVGVLALSAVGLFWLLKG
jgi:hypothetical protein